MTKEEVRACIEGTGILAAIRVSSAELAHYAAEAVNRGGIPVAEITMTTPRAIDVIAQLAQT